MNLLQVLAADAYEFEAKSELSGVQISLILALSLLVVVGMWKAFAKAGQPGWAVLIPIYNIYVMCKIAGRPGWWVFLFLVPLVNFVILFIVNIDIASPAFAAQVAALDPSAPYAVYCRSGNRSASALAEMAAVGMTGAYHLGGGIGAWQSAGGEVVTG